MAIFKVTAVPDFSQLKSELTKLQGSPVTLNVDTQQANVNLKATAQNLTKLTQVFDGNNRLTGAVSQFSGKVGETVQITQRLNAETGKLETTQGKVTQNFEAQSRAAQKAAAQMRAANDAYRAYAAQQSGTYTPTAIQSRIEDITGIGGLSGKSAKESATVFEKAFLTASGKVQQSAEKAAQKVKSVGQAAKESSGFADLMGKSFGKIVAQMAMWQLLGNAIAGVKRSFTEALETMKDVDDEMVTIRKVTGATTAELDKIEKQAYETASAYGVAADEYLNSVANFSRAGYGEQASALAELATKTQIVGDTDAETAQQFLLSVDAAYQYKGSIEQLTKVLDGANEIDNKYATSISKIAEGLGKVAPIAAQAHVGVDELTAAIGTITAVTQRSGTEASTALRALFLNIIGDTKTEIDEGVTWTTGEIAGLRDVIRIYAKDAYDAAQATGSVIDPMKAIAGLAQSMKDGLLTEQQLMEMVSDIGGKLRTSQLLALIQNWDMYESMLGDFADAAGSADKEVENALDSWSRKTEILHNKWTEFVSHLVETDTIKAALDVVIGTVELLDSTGGHLIVTVGLLTAAVFLLGQVKKELRGSEAVKDIKKAITSVKTLTQETLAYAAAKKAAAEKNHAAESALTFMEADGIADSEKKFASLAGKLKALGIGAAIFAALAVAINLSTEKARDYEKSLEDVKAAQSALDETKSEYDELINKTEELTDAEKRRLEVLQATREEQEKQLEAAKKKAWEDWNAIHGTGATVIVDGMDANTGGMAVGAAKTERMDIVALRNYREELAQIEEQYRAGEMSAGEYYTALEKLNAAREESVETIRAAIAAGYDVTEEQKALVAAYDNTSIILGKVTGITYEWIASLIEEARAAGTAEDALYDTVSAAKILSNTKLDLNQQIQALAMLRFQLEQTAIQAAYTAKEISLVGLLTGTVGNIISSTVSSVLDGAGSAGQESGVSAAAGSSSGGSSGSGGSSDAAERKRAQAAIKELEKQRDAEIEPLEDQIDALKKQNEEIERGEKLEELKLDVLKKQDALLNARNERTVRQYNAATGQWEWVADANKVKDAEEDLENAKKDLRDYEREVELDLAVAELEARIEAIKAAYQIKIDAWQDYLDGLDGAVAAEGEYLNTSVKQNKDAAEAIADAWEEAAERKRKAQAAISAAAGAAADVPSSTNPSTSAAVSGAVGGAANSPSSTKPSASGAVAGAVGGAAKPKPSGGGGVNKVARYDSGGVLKGLGGIKATVDDEMVLPPDITEKMLRPSANGVFRQRMGELGYLYGVERPAAQNMAGKSDNRSYTDHSGPEYHYGSITLTKEQAETTTVAELRRMAHHLQPYGG